ncbi:MAG: type IX secretion system membrane protein PorP/SprF [Flavobacteriaceae bacterium]|nr:type IX secretion system membrane protein PorP/SprF [Flavobacteriaceae bacterium]
MMKKLLLLFFFSVITGITAQETFPVNFDYLSDNIYLIHPAAAGIGNCSKIRLTYGQQWLGMEDGPSLQTLSYHDRITERAAIGGIVFNDKNGYHSKWGFTGTYAYHINFDREDMMNQLSFGTLTDVPPKQPRPDRFCHRRSFP